MKLRHLMMTIAASAMVAAPALASPVTNPASSLSLSNARVGTVDGKKDKLSGTGLIVAGVAAVAIGVGIYFAVRKNNPASN